MNGFKSDTHMHFDLYKDRDAVMNYIEAQHSYTLAMTNLPEIYERYIGLYNNYKYVRIALGFHPELAYRYQHQILTFRRLSSSTRYIGEVGLDYKTADNTNKTVQRSIFYAIIEACESDSNSKVISIHSRRAEADVIDILRDVKKSKVILHWYSGSLDSMESALDLGCYFSVNQNMVRSTSGKKIINSIPLDRILIESDAPFTIGLKEMYTTSFVDSIYQYISESHTISVESVVSAIKHNFSSMLES